MFSLLMKMFQSSKSLKSYFFLLISFVCFYPPILFSLCGCKQGREKANALLGWRSRALHRGETPPLLLSGRVRLQLSLRARKNSSHRHGKGTGLVCESLTGFFPATGCAPHVSLLHAVHLSALLCFPTGFPGSWC